MTENHTASFDYFDVEATVNDEGDVRIEFRFPEPVDSISMDWGDFREVIEFVAKHGLAITNPWLGEYEMTVEGASE